MSKYPGFCIEFSGDDEDAIKSIQEVMNAQTDATNTEINKISNELNVSVSCAMDIYYLRTRSRWTQELEDELIDLHDQGERPNMNEFGTKY